MGRPPATSRQKLAIQPSLKPLLRANLIVCPDFAISPIAVSGFAAV
jgi:hypothetical protein